MGTFYEYQTKIDASQAGMLSHCRPSGVLGILQEAAIQAACEFHASGPEMLEKYGALWMVSRIWYRLDKPLFWRDEVRVKTWHRADRGASLYRDFDLYINGEPAGEAVSIWVLVDAENRKLVRLSTVEELDGTGGEELNKSKKLSGIKLPEGMAAAGKRRFHYSDTDSNGHVNNVRYADIAADALCLEKLLPGHFVSSLQMGYLKECMAEEEISVWTGAVEQARFVLGTDRDGVNRFNACLSLDEWTKT